MPLSSLAYKADPTITPQPPSLLPSRKPPQPTFKDYAAQMVKNTKAMAEEFEKLGIHMFSGGSDNHLILIDLSNIGPIGILAEYALDLAHMTCNKNTIPEDPSSPFYPSGIRVGTPALTTRGFKEAGNETGGPVDHQSRRSPQIRSGSHRQSCPQSLY
jgi:hypothetical protein